MSAGQQGGGGSISPGSASTVLHPEIMTTLMRRGTIMGGDLRANGKMADVGDESFKGHLSRRFGAVDLDRIMSAPGLSLATVKDEYYHYYYYQFVKQWRLMAIVAWLVALMFSVYVLVLRAYLPIADSDATHFEYEAPKTAPIALVAIIIVMLIMPVIEIVLMAIPSIFQRYGLRIHFFTLLIYGSTLALLELYLNSLTVAAYLFPVLLFTYTNTCQPPLPTAFLGCFVSLLDWVCLVIAVKSQPYMNHMCHEHSDIPCEHRLAGNLIMYIAANLAGVCYSINSWNYTRKTFLINRELYLKKKHFEDELNKAEYIALSILPKTVWDELKGGQHQRFDMDSIFHKSLMYFYSDVTIVFADIAGFTALSGTMSATSLVKLLNTIFFDFDMIVGDLGIEKIKTIGDCYMIAAGAPNPVKDHARKAVIAAFRMIRVVYAMRTQYPMLAVRVGVHTGDVYAGLIGLEKFIFDVFSNDVIVASHVEQTGIPNEVHVSDATYQQIKHDCLAREGPPVTVFSRDIPSYFITEIRDVVTNAMITKDGSPSTSPPNLAGPKGSEDQMTIGSQQSNTTGSVVSGAMGGSTHHQNQHSTLRRLAHLQRKFIATSRGRLTSNVVSYLVKDSASATGGSSPTIPGALEGVPTGESPNHSRIIRGDESIRTTNSPPPSSMSVGSNPNIKEASIRSGKGANTDAAQDKPMSVIKTSRLRSPSSDGPGSPDSIGTSASPPSPSGPGPEKRRMSMSQPPLSSRRHKSLLKLTMDTAEAQNEMNLHPVTRHFRDRYVEMDFQDNYVARCTGKMAFPLIGMTAQALIFMAFDWVVFFPGPTTTQLGLLIASHMSLILVLGFCSLLAMSKYIATLDSKLGWAVRWGAAINFQKAGPIVLFFMWATRMVHATRHNMSDYLLGQLYPIMMIATLWTRLSSLVLAFSLLVMVFLGQAFAAFFLLGQSSTQLLWNALLQILTLAGTFTIMRRMETYIRHNYIMKKHLGSKQFEIDDLRIKSERLLYKLLPRPVVAKLKQRSSSSSPGGGAGSEIAEAVDSAGIIFCTICHFKEMDQASMTVLNDIICKFDGMIAKYDIEKIKTIGPIYMASSGLSRVFSGNGDAKKSGGQPLDESHATNLADFALALRAKMVQLNKEYPKQYSLRIGLAVGPLVAGIIGKTKFAYDVWGDTCNVASRMDSTGMPDQIQVTEHLYHLLKKDYVFRERGVIKVKGKGEMRTYMLLGKKGRLRSATVSGGHVPGLMATSRSSSKSAADVQPQQGQSHLDTPPPSPNDDSQRNPASLSTTPQDRARSVSDSRALQSSPLQLRKSGIVYAPSPLRTE
ncbi:hypothetical protein BCR44DRAFT_1488300 [Catenaria anguillulae PL171]|uniref:adenylate cyclase n=1 Tax=Catenaria anguillulae PL171 TaxID=765915 RepID=A0A1Y2H888_9FUNG|nr:hypothetical protein BCR44DRAFT_1488300 [Catenaria anguillulae PL171]